DIEMVARAPWPAFDTGPCLRFPRQAQFHPLKFIAGLARAISLHGGQIFNNTHVDRIEGGKQAHVKAGKFTVRARNIVVATNTPVNDLIAIHTKQAPYMTYVIAARIARGVAPTALVWDTADPYHYVRVKRQVTESGSGSPHDNCDLLIVGGEDHKTGQSDHTE